jgi:hypothetical protein
MGRVGIVLGVTCQRASGAAVGERVRRQRVRHPESSVVWVGRRRDRQLRTGGCAMGHVGTCWV